MIYWKKENEGWNKFFVALESEKMIIWDRVRKTAQNKG